MAAAVVIELTTGQKAAAKAEWPYEVKLLEVSSVFADDSYQRPVHTSFVRQIAEQFDPRLVGVIDVSERRNDRFAVIDGQQRLEAIKINGLTKVWAAVYSGLSRPQEALFFHMKNKDRRTMPPYYSFRARIVGKDPIALHIVEIVENEGLALGPSSNNEDTIGAIRAIQDAYGYSSEWRTESLSPTLRTLRQSVRGRKSAFDAELIRGMGRFWKNYGDDEIDFDTLTRAIGELGAVPILGMAKDRSFGAAGRHGHSAGFQVARVIAEEYNKAVQGGKVGRNYHRIDVKRLAA